MTIKNILLISCVLFGNAFSTLAQTGSIDLPQKRYYNPKNTYVGISGDVQTIMTSTLEHKIFHNDVKIDEPISWHGETMARELTSAGVGKKILDYLFQYNGKRLSEEMLRERAFQNAQLFDKELAEVGVIDKTTILKDDILPVLENNYIIISSLEKWHVFKVEINKEIWDQVYNCWEDMEQYNKIRVPITFVASIKHKSSPTKNLRKISKKVPAFAIRGQIADHHPLCVGAGRNDGVQKFDRMFIYRTSTDKHGNPISKKISTVRVGKIAADSAWVYTVAGGFASQKRGDVAVLMPDRKNGHSFTANTQGGAYGFSYTYDRIVGNNPYGFASYFLTSLGVSIYPETWEKKAFSYDNTLLYPPTILDFSLGYAFGWTWFHCLEIAPFFSVQYEGLSFNEHKTKELEKYERNKGIDDKIYWAHSIRLPVGVKANLNLFYPVQLTVGATYDILALKVNGQKLNIDYERAEKYFLEPMGYKRSGLNIFAGLRICY